jgi:hypothetical protein
MNFFFAVVAIFLWTSAAFADAPNLLITSHYDKVLDSLRISASVEWNKNDYLEQNKARLAREDVFYGGRSGTKLVRQYAVKGEHIRAEMVFPKIEGGRRLDATARRIELRLYRNDRLFFQTLNFGVFGEEPTAFFCPSSLSLFQAGGLLTIAVFGTYTKDNGFHDDLGKTIEFATSNGAVPLDKGMYFEKEVDALPMIDDNLMTSMLQAREK